MLNAAWLLYECEGMFSTVELLLHVVSAAVTVRGALDKPWCRQW